MLTIGEIKMNIIQNTNRTEPTFRYLIVDSVFFGIPNTDVGIGIGFFKYWISVRYFRYTDPRLLHIVVSLVSVKFQIYFIEYATHAVQTYYSIHIKRSNKTINERLKKNPRTQHYWQIWTILQI